MPRKARSKSKTGIYHIILRGINRQRIFHDEEDCQKYLENLQRMKKQNEYELLGYCLMVNHIHLLIKEGKEDISTIMKRLGTSYAWWYNQKYERSGHLFQDRFKSECVEDDKYLVTVIRYIHRNPVKAGMVDMPDRYKWSSCGAYYGVLEHPEKLTRTAMILEIFDGDQGKAVSEFRSFMEMDNEDKCLEDDEVTRINDEKVKDEIVKLLKGKPIKSLQQMPKKERAEVLREIKKINGSSLRQISKVTGIGLNVIFRA